MFKYGIGIAVIVSTVLLALFLQKPASAPFAEAATIAQGAKGFQELQERFEDLAEEKGGSYAFEVLKRATVPPNTDLHLLGHAVGDILYTQKGVIGIAECTQDFRNACSHSIVIGALNEFGGEAALGMIRDACKKAPGGSGAYTMCYHGLGHGVFAFFGYELTQTVDVCRKTGSPEYHNREYIECVGGAIMELMGGGGHNRNAWLAAREKYLANKGPLSPCMDDIVPYETKGLCLTYLTPRIWEFAGIDLGNPDPGLFADAFAYCYAIPYSEQHLRDACFGGFGKEFLPLVASRDVRDDVQYSDVQLSTVIEWCESAAIRDGIEACVAEALSSAFWGGEKDPETSFRLCDAAAERGFDDACYERLAESIEQYVQPPQRGELCSRVPESQRHICEK